MAKDEVFTAVRDSCTILGGFLTEVSQEVGMDRTTEMYGRVFDGFGDMIANVVEEHRGDSEGAGKVAAYLEQLYEGFGIDAFRKLRVSDGYKVEYNATVSGAPS